MLKCQTFFNQKSLFAFFFGKSHIDQVNRMELNMRNLDSKSYYVNRELSWLAFNNRVLAEAMNKSNPLLDRFKFISIAASNLDEFFMVRVAGLKDQVKMGSNHPENKTQMTPAQQLMEISRRAHTHLDKLYSVAKSCINNLKSIGIKFVHPHELSKEQREFLTAYFDTQIFPVLTPITVDSTRPFPKVASRRLNLVVLLESKAEEGGIDNLFAIVQIPSVLPRFVELPSSNGEISYVFLEDVIEHQIGRLFSGSKVVETACFRITRNADITLDEDVEDILEEIKKELKNRRKKGDIVRLEIGRNMSHTMKETLRNWLDLIEEDIYLINGPVDATCFGELYNLPDCDHLRHAQITPQVPQNLIGEDNLFHAIAQKDIMLFHPYESFDPVVKFIQQAADDPDVLAVKQTLYRVSGNSPIVRALMRAAENGKQVTVILELKARFDEANNIQWANTLEESGCHVIYGLVGLKTHSKISLVVRKEGNRLCRYVHLGTGNYNDITARIYTDIGMFTAREDFCEDATAFFNHLTGCTGLSSVPLWKQISTAPRGLKDRFLTLIENEMDKSTPENPGRIIAKMNSLTNKDIIKALYKASCNGVQIDLIVRGICCLRPGIVGVSENIRVSSIVGQQLEHSRIYYFQNGGDEFLYLSSADWMTRNLENRVEILFPVIQENLRERLKHILNSQLSDNVNRYILTSSGAYRKVKSKDNESPFASQSYFYQEACQHVIVSETAHHQMVPISVV